MILHMYSKYNCGSSALYHYTMLIVTYVPYVDHTILAHQNHDLLTINL